MSRDVVNGKTVDRLLVCLSTLLTYRSREFETKLIAFVLCLWRNREESTLLKCQSNVMLELKEG